MLRLLKNLKELYKYRALIQNLISRELKARYRGTILGFLWSFFNPLLLMIVYTIVFGFIIQPRDPAFEGSPWLYALFLFCGVLPWVWFSSSSLESANVLMVHGNLIKKILFPAEILPIVVVSSNLIHFFFGLPILFIFVPIFGKAYTPFLLFLPIVILLQFVFSLGFSFLISSLTVHFRDIKDILANLITFWFFASPIVYPMTFHTIQKSSLLRTMLNLNPMTHVMQGYQNCVFYGRALQWEKIGLTFAFSIVLFFIGYYIFDRLRDSFPEEV
ncbi:MAG: ABC transporter permease [Candidatus Aminicenantes bacterium]|nr:MAG: ABC transporter permease [Candidatus Aminicenantes bacterium]